MTRLRYEVLITWRRDQMPEVKPFESEPEARAGFVAAIASRKVKGDVLLGIEREFEPLCVQLYSRKRRVRRGVARWDLHEQVAIWRRGLPSA